MELFPSTLIADRPQLHGSIRIIVVLTALITVLSALRLLSRHHARPPMIVEDTLLYASLAVYYIMIAAFFLFIYFGAGYHINQLELPNLARLIQTVIAIQPLYGLALCTSKWRMLWMLKRIFVTRAFGIFVWAIIGCQAAWLVMNVVVSVFNCTPVQMSWDPTVEGTCRDQIAGFTAVGVVNVIIDMFMCFLPLPMICRMKIKKHYKGAWSHIISIGFASVVFTTLRLLSLRSLESADFSYAIPEFIILMYFEIGILVLGACAPRLRSLLDPMHRRRSSTKSDLPGPSTGKKVVQSTIGSKSQV